jgi:hypothetical protein
MASAARAPHARHTSFFIYKCLICKCRRPLFFLFSSISPPLLPLRTSSCWSATTASPPCRTPFPPFSLFLCPSENFLGADLPSSLFSRVSASTGETQGHLPRASGSPRAHVKECTGKKRTKSAHQYHLLLQSQLEDPHRGCTGVRSANVVTDQTTFTIRSIM